MRSVLLAVLLVLATTLTAACGQDSERGGLLAQSRANDLKDGLADVETAVEAGSCTRVEEELGGLRTILDELPARTDAELRERLDEGIGRLEQQAPQECEDQTTETQPETTPETTPTEPPAETTPPVETTPTEPPTETVPPPVEEVPGTEEGQEGGAGDEETPGNGNGNGNGPPGGIPPGQAGGEEAPGR